MPPSTAPAPKAPTRSPAPAFESPNSSAYPGTSGPSAPNSIASTSMIVLTRTSSLRIAATLAIARTTYRGLQCTASGIFARHDSA